ncbi:hypothetical protein I6M70_17005 [Acinetobacter pittii]|uniref:hypothetical protein n=1 Tax=Acinetobacter pittii TaxID=48296 RepID=UPI00190186A8|nr:hypothetical protein [Acinetobacter pittii]MBJ8481059.1 hypothetical protein [Acinetobacter pittii]
MNNKEKKSIKSILHLIIFLIILVAALVAAIQFYKSFFGLNTDEAVSEITFKIIAEAFIVLISALVSGRYLSTFLIVGIPCSYYWLQPLLNYKAMQVYNMSYTIPFYGSETGNLVLAIFLVILGFGCWALKMLKD